MSAVPELAIRPAVPQDCPQILGFIRELAEYENASHKMTATVESIHELLFGKRPVAEAILAIYQEEPVGFAFFYPVCSTYQGKSAIYLEDLYVRKEFRACGIGRALLSHLAKLTIERGGFRLQWTAVRWNKTAIEYYDYIGASRYDDALAFHLTGEALENMAR